jgi:hypothetical protein
LKLTPNATEAQHLQEQKESNRSNTNHYSIQHHTKQTQSTTSNSSSTLINTSSSKNHSIVNAHCNLDPMLSFNVAGEKICILRSTVLKGAPHSLLAARVSGLWIEQAKDLDSDGNICLVSFIYLFFYFFVFVLYFLLFL